MSCNARSGKVAYRSVLVRHRAGRKSTVQFCVAVVLRCTTRFVWFSGERSGCRFVGSHMVLVGQGPVKCGLVLLGLGTVV